MSDDDDTGWDRRRVLAAGGAAAVVAAGGFAWWRWGRNRTPPPPPLPDDAGLAMAEAFLADLRAGKVDAAWAGTSADFKSFRGREEFRAFVRSNPVLRKPAAFDATDRPAGGAAGVMAVYRFRPDGGGGVIAVTLAPTDGTWRVEGLAVE